MKIIKLAQSSGVPDGYCIIETTIEGGNVSRKIIRDLKSYHTTEEEQLIMDLQSASIEGFPDEELIADGKMYDGAEVLQQSPVVTQKTKEKAKDITPLIPTKQKEKQKQHLGLGFNV